MKRQQLFATAKRVFAVFATTLLFAGCEGLFPGLGEDPKGEQITITASTENTRVSIDSEDRVLWKTDDSFTVQAIENNDGTMIEVFSLLSGVDQSTGSFTGTKPEWSGRSYAYYGAAASGAFSARVPATQEYNWDGGFSMDVLPMAAVCENIEDGVQFKNVAGIIEFNITGTQRLASIEVSADESLSGVFDIDQTTFVKNSSVSEGGDIVLTNIDHSLYEDRAMPFRIAVIPGTYHNLTVKMVNKDGSSVTKTAEEAIVVERSAITPIEGLVDGTEPVETTKYINLSFVEEECNWNQAKVKCEILDVETLFEKHILYMWGTDAFINEWMAANTGKTILDMMAEQGGVYNEDIEFTYNVAPGTNYNFYAVCISNGADSVSTYGDVQHISYLPEIPYHESATLSIEVPEATITETSAVAHITPSTTFAKVYIGLYTAAVDTNNSAEVIFLNVVKKAMSVHENVSAAFDEPLEGFAPASQYVVYAVGETADGKYTHLTKQFITTPEHIAAAVTATASIVEVKDWSAKFNIALSEGATGYKYAFFPKATVDNNPDVDWAFEVSSYDTFRTDPELSATNLTESTEYVLATIAYDANEAYGEISMLNFTTTALVADYYAVGYDKFLGQWTVSYTDSDGTRFEDQHEATVSQVVAGRLYAIKGLGGGGLGQIDDTVYARFNGDGQPITIPDSEVLYAGQYDESYHILLTMLVGNTLYTNGPSFWENADGTFGVGDPGDPVNSGFTVSAFYKSNGGYAGTLSLFTNVIMKKKNEYGASTENYSRKESVSPTWKSVNPLQLRKYNFNIVK
ncbi:MAG: hypothetical protein E7130_07560 [Rikenellaceae bacterium]|nr:hypothetical protein [Rikenellaceae bacterium]